MKHALIIAALLASSAHADTLGLHIGSWHEGGGYNNVNPGLYWRDDSGLTIGAYRNSLERTTAYAGWTWTHRIGSGVDVGLSIAGATGYRMTVTPMVLPSVGIRLGGDWSARIGWLPKIDPKRGTNVLHLTLERAL